LTATTSQIFDGPVNKVPPVAAAFDQLLNLRQSVGLNPNDLAARFVAFCAANMLRSRAQLFQDLLVLFFSAGKRNGFFVEFGATDGADLSNSLILERDFQWSGILAEPARGWHSALKSSRKAKIDTRLVWSTSGDTLEFKETEARELSTLSTLVERDFNRGGRTRGDTYPVETISLNDLLAQHQAPRQIDYLSIDTEGSEWPILQAFDLSKYDVKIVTIEHNFCEPDRQKICDHLTQHGFVRLFESFSKFDDWYIQRSIVGFGGTL
jgi:FkbM family methyltransferase